MCYNTMTAVYLLFYLQCSLWTGLNKMQVIVQILIIVNTGLNSAQFMYWSKIALCTYWSKYNAVCLRV